MQLDQLPLDVLLEHIVQWVDADDLLALSATCHLMHIVCNDDRLWQHRVLTDFWHAMPGLAAILRRQPPRHGWKQLYKILNSQRVYTWGENSGMQLNSCRGPMTCQVHYPCELEMLRSKGITQLVAGGWSFHALDRRGRVWMWGLMRPRSPFRAIWTSCVDSPVVPIPRRVKFPSHVRIHMLSSGRSHVVALDSAGRVWHWSNCRRPQPVPGCRASSVTATWRLSAILLKDGRLWMIPYPSIGDSDSSASPSTREKQPIEIHVINDNDDDKILYIAGMAAGVIVLTQKGRVFHVSHCSYRACEHERASAALAGRQLIALTSQHDQYAVVCDTVTVIGRMDGEEIRLLDIAAEDEDDAIQKIAFGDFHFGALTRKGRLLTWGVHWSSALGRGYEPTWPQIPQAVNSLDRMHILDAAFGGHHSGCLAIPREALL
ncbi:regulator of chromosome condensation 1/beta-lactamase-inhibitor protein II [Dichotomocladium elegans]|nr:regulator of chromosome condensation 1/beta-lactamase-inhibitor protein II [Dichotomocladium elegans]